MKIKTIFLTGGTGFIGSHVLQMLLKIPSIEHIILLSRQNHANSLVNEDRITMIHGDLKSPKFLSLLDDFSPEIDAVLHLAALANDNMPYKELHHINVLGTKALLEYSISSMKNLAFFFYLSSTGVYGLNLPDYPITEDYPKNPSSSYQKTKWQAEKLCWRFNKDYQLPMITFRPPTTIGPGDYTTSFKIADAILERRFPLIGNGKNLLTLIDVRDLAYAITLLLKKTQMALNKAYNLYSYVISLEDFLFSFYNELDGSEKNKPKKYNFYALYFYGWLNELKSQLITHKPAKINRYRVLKFAKTRLYNMNRIQNDLGFNSKYSFFQTLKDTVAWLYQVHPQLQRNKKAKN